MLVIPVGAAFGTGEHATTAMSLRLLEQLAKKLPRDWRMLDLGTGSGILALAARKLGAREATGLDVDPLAISTAKANAQANKISHAHFLVGDARGLAAGGRFHVVTANLFSGLLVEILPKLKTTRWLIASGVLRTQENAVVEAARRSGFGIEQIRRRGKWIAILCRHGG
jgi:ribosomal protein L11 methyltransferase